MARTIFNCSNCNKVLSKGDRNYCDKTDETECSECRFHMLNGTRTIKKYNEWLRRD